MAESEPEAVVFLNRAGRYVDGNPRFCALTGYDRDELVTLSIGDLSAPRERRAAVDVWSRYVAGAILIRVGRFHNLRRKDGTYVWTQTTYLGPTHDPDVFEARWQIVSPRPITTPRPASLQSILTAWRDAERELTRLEPGDPDAAELRRVADELRAVYQSESAIRDMLTRP